MNNSIESGTKFKLLKYYLKNASIKAVVFSDVK